MGHRLAVNRSTRRHQPHWPLRTGAIAVAALAATLAGTPAAEAADLRATAQRVQIYRVLMANPPYPILLDSEDVSNERTTTDPSVRINANYGGGAALAFSKIGELNVLASYNGRSRDLAPQIVIPPLGNSPVPVYQIDRIQGWLDGTSAVSRVTDRFTAASTFFATANLYAASDLTLDLNVRTARQDWYGGGRAYGTMQVSNVLSYQLDDITPDASGNVIRQTVGTMNFNSNLEVRDLKLVRTTVVNTLSERSFTYDATVERSNFVFRDGALVSSFREGFGGFDRTTDEDGDVFTHNTDRNVTARFNVVAGRQYELTTSFSCTAYLGGLTAFLQGGSARCSALNSAYWNGLSDVTDADGRPLENVDVVSEGGFNYRWANPSSPSPDAIFSPSLVPEPGTWALLAAGLALVASRARSVRRQQAGCAAA